MDATPETIQGKRGRGMTREEAIQVLKKTIAYESDFAEAKRMAIEALSAGALEYESTVTLNSPISISAGYEWIESRYVCTCSHCGYLVELKTPFCPNCGVKMKGEYK